MTSNATMTNTKYWPQKIKEMCLTSGFDKTSLSLQLPLGLEAGVLLDELV